MKDQLIVEVNGNYSLIANVYTKLNKYLNLVSIVTTLLRIKQKVRSFKQELNKSS